MIVSNMPNQINIITIARDGRAKQNILISAAWQQYMNLYITKHLLQQKEAVLLEQPLQLCTEYF